MQSTKLLQALRTLSTRERTRWRQYVHSDFLNKHLLLRALADEILRFAPDFLAPELEKKLVHARITGDSIPYNELKFNNLVSDLYELLLGFLAFAQHETDVLSNQIRVAGALLDRNLDTQAAQALAKCRVLLDRLPRQTARRQFLEIQWWELAETLESRQPRRVAGEHLHRQADAIDLAFVLEKLRLGAAQLSRQRLAVLQSDEQPRWLPHVRQWCQTEPLLAEAPAVQVYLAALELLEQPNGDTFQGLATALDLHHPVFEPEELSALYQYALNYCIRRINDGQAGAYEQTLGLYQVLLDRQVLLRQGRMSQWTYKNITTTGLRSGAFAWTEQFLHQYRNTLPPAEQANAFAYNLAALFYEKQDFSATLITLQNVEFTDFTYHLGAKILQLKCFFLLRETEALTALLEATQQLLRRNRSLSAFGKTANLNFLLLLRALSAWKQQENLVSEGKWQQRRAGLLEKVRQLHPVANKDWLLEMLE